MPETRRENIVGFRHFHVLGTLFLCFFVSWLLSVVYLFILDSSSDYLIREVRAQDEWSQHFTADQGPRLIVTGGSSCTFSIDGGTATEQFHVPVINAGLEAAIGAYGIVLESSRLAHQGDTLVLAIEPSLYTSPLSYTQDALQLMARRFAWDRVLQAKEITGRAVPLDGLLFSPRPGLANFAAFLGRTFTGVPFRYASAQIRPGGLSVTEFRYQLEGKGDGPGITPNNRDLLLHFRDWASKKGVKLVCSLPWLQVADWRVNDQKRVDAQFVSEMAAMMPVVHDESFGVRTDRSLFADTSWHLTAAAAQVRTSELVKQVLAGDFWTADELADAELKLR